MKKSISEIVYECINNSNLKELFIIDRNMTLDESEAKEADFSRMIGYCILFNSNDGIEEYMNIKTEDEQINYLKMKIANILSIPYNRINERIDEIKEYVYDNFIANGYVFHAGNSDAVNKDMNFGLGYKKYSQQNLEELKRISSIYEKYDKYSVPFGWGIMDINNKKEGWFYDNVPRNMMYYANSPEWFGHLCGEDASYGWGVVSEERRHGYANRDYDSCVFAINKLMNKINMSSYDRQEVFNFFNKCWDKYKDTKPYMLFIPTAEVEKNAIDKNRYFPSEDRIKLFEKEFFDNYIFRDVIRGGCSFAGFNKCSTQYIDPKKLTYIDLSPIMPRYIYQDIQDFGRGI